MLTTHGPGPCTPASTNATMLLGAQIDYDNEVAQARCPLPVRHGAAWVWEQRTSFGHRTSTGATVGGRLLLQTLRAEIDRFAGAPLQVDLCNRRNVTQLAPCISFASSAIAH